MIKPMGKRNEDKRGISHDVRSKERRRSGCANISEEGDSHPPFYRPEMVLSATHGRHSRTKRKRLTTLVLHPKDRRTDCLKAIYAKVPNVTLVTGGESHGRIREMIESHDRVFMLGMGDPWGLFSNGRFPHGFWVVGDSHAELLRSKNGTGSLLIWPDSDKFVRRHGLDMIGTGHLPLADMEWGESDEERVKEMVESIRSLIEDGIVQRVTERLEFSLGKAYKCLSTDSLKEYQHRIEWPDRTFGMRA